MTWGVEVRSVSKTFPQRPKQTTVAAALNDISLSVNPGELVTLLGPSGCGKTTLLRIIAGLEQPSEGQILLRQAEQTVIFVDQDKNIFLEPYERQVGLVFQSYALWPHKTVKQNIAYPLEIQKIAREEREKRIADILRSVDLSDLAARYPHELSGGQQQRIALARALVQRPRVLLLDEPLSNLDVALRTSVRREIKELNRSLGLTMIYVTHDRAEALELSDRMFIFERGQVVQSGTAAEVTASPANEFVRMILGI